jgi:hypothetical protein
VWRSSGLVTSLCGFIISLAVAGQPGAASKGTRFEQGAKLFNQGDFEGALRQLDLAAQDERDPAILEKLHLLRGQCFSARQDFVRAEDAFALALEANPEASLDPARVDPTVVKLLEAVRARLTTVLQVSSTPPGAVLMLDGKSVGVTPQSVAAPIGKRKLEARWGDGPLTVVEVVLKPKKEMRVELIQSAAPPPVRVQVEPEPKPIKPYGDLRGTGEVPSAMGAAPTGGIDLGGGFEWKFFRAGLYGRLFPYFGVIPRIALVVPVLQKFNVFLEVHVPLLFRNGGIGFGVGGAGGGEFLALPWLGVFAQIGGQHLFINDNRGDPTSFIASAGVRLRVP